MSIFSKLTTDGLEDSKDTLGGFTYRDTGIYELKIKAAYVSVSKGGATAINLIGEDDKGEYREAFYITNKEGSNFYVDSRSGKKRALPGFELINSLCLIVTGKPLSEQTDVEEKTINLYDPEHKKELPTKVNMIMSLINETVTVAITKELINKQVKNPTSNEYENEFKDGEPVTQERNSVSKFFDVETCRTSNEILDEVEEAQFIVKWREKNEGKTIDKVKKDSNNGSSGKPPTSSKGSSSPKKSLFS